MIEIDGSSGEGGGQIPRTGEPVRIDEVRAVRSKLGLLRVVRADRSSLSDVIACRQHGPGEVG